jgi:DNA-binding winged helix-turn-helix (wHTH) protein/TolB-like protein
MGVVRVADHRIDTDRRIVFDDAGRIVELRPQALELLCVLAERAGEVLSKHELFERVWPGLVITDDSLVQAISDARRAIGDEGHRTIQTVPRRGYRLVADAQPAGGAGVPPRERPRWVGALVLVAVVVAGIVTLASSALQPALLERSSKPALAVLAFRAEPDAPGDVLLGQGIAGDLIAELARDAAMPVVSGHSSFQPELQALSAQDAASRLRVRYLVDGNVRHAGDELLIRIQLVDGADGRIVWARDARAKASELGSLRTDIVGQLAGSVDASVRRAEKQRAMARPPSSMDAYMLAMRAYAGKHQFTPAGHSAARADAEQALKLDPEYAFAWALLAYVNSTDAQFRITGRWSDPRPRLQQALEQADRAVQLDPALPIAHAARADALLGLDQLPQARATAAAAARLAPGDADILNQLAGVQLLNERIDEAVRTLNRELLLLPIVPVYARFTEGLVRWGARDFEPALAAAGDCVARAPRHTGCLILRATVLAELGRLDDARSDVERFREIAPGARQKHLLEPFGHAPGLRARRQKAVEQLGFAPEP